MSAVLCVVCDMCMALLCGTHIAMCCIVLDVCGMINVFEWSV